MRIQVVIAVLVIIFAACKNSNTLSSDHLSKIKRTLVESNTQVESHNLMTEAVIRNEVWDRSYSLYDSIEIVMDTILSEFSKIENDLENSFSLNPRIKVSSNEIIDFGSWPISVGLTNFVS